MTSFSLGVKMFWRYELITQGFVEPPRQSQFDAALTSVHGAIIYEARPRYLPTAGDNNHEWPNKEVWAYNLECAVAINTCHAIYY